MNFLQKISNIFQRLRYTPNSNNERNHDNGSNNEELDEEENIEMVSTSITRSIYQENDDEEDVFSSATNFINSSDTESGTWTKSRSQSRFSSSTYHSSLSNDTDNYEECTETCCIEAGEVVNEWTEENTILDSSRRESEIYEARTDSPISSISSDRLKSVDSNYTLELNCYTDTEEVTPANFFAYAVELDEDGYPRKSILKKSTNKSTTTDKSAKSRRRSTVHFIGENFSKYQSVTSVAVKEALTALGRQNSSASHININTDMESGVRIPSIASIDLLKHQAEIYGSGSRLSIKSDIFLKSDKDEDQKMNTFQNYTDLERQNSKAESLDKEVKSEKTTTMKEPSHVIQSEELNKTETPKEIQEKAADDEKKVVGRTEDDVSEVSEYSQFSEVSAGSETDEVFETSYLDVDGDAKRTPKRRMFVKVRSMKNAAVTHVRKWLGRKQKAQKRKIQETPTEPDIAWETSPDYDDDHDNDDQDDDDHDDDDKSKPMPVKKRRKRFWESFKRNKSKKVKYSKFKRKSKKKKRKFADEKFPRPKDKDLFHEYKFPDILNLDYDDISAIKDLIEKPSESASTASLASVSPWTSMGGDAAARFGSFTRYAQSATNLDGIASRFSILPEFKIEHIKYHCCRRRVYTVPVNLHAVDKQYRDMKRGDLVRLQQDQLLTLYNFEIKKSTPTKALSQLWKFLKKIFKYGTAEDRITLNNYEFYAFLIFHDIYLGNLIRDFRLIEEFGPLIGIHVKLIIISFIDTPIMMFILTMAGMTRFTYIKFYHSMPVLRGFGYGMFVLFLLHEVVSWANFDLGMRCVVRLIKERDKWQKCPTENSNWKEKCIPSTTNQSHNTFCPDDHTRWNGTENFASQNFMRFMMTNLYDDIALSNWQMNVLHICMASAWIMIFATAWIGFRRSKFVLLIVQHIAMFVLFITCISIIPYRSGYDILTSYYRIWNLLHLEVLQHVINACCFAFLRLPFLVWIASMRPDKFDPESTTVMVLFVKICLYLALYLSAHVCVLHVITTYKINTKCLVIEDIVYVYALIPDFFSGSTFGPLLTTIWMSMWNIFSLIRAMLILQMAHETICEIFPTFRKYPFLVLATLSVTCVTIIRLHYYKSTSDFMTKTFLLNVDACVTMTTAMFILGLKFIYTWIRFRDDFYFMYKRFPSNFWEIWLNTASFFSLVLLCFVIAKEVIFDNLQNLTAVAIIVLILILAFTVLLKHLCYFIYNRRTTEAIRPNNDWLPDDPDLKHSRRYYFSARDIRARRPRKLYLCTHKCLNQSQQYKQIVRKQKFFLSEVQRAGAMWKNVHDEEKKRSGVSTLPTW